MLVAKGGSGVNETDPTKYQVWRSGALAPEMLISGDATIDFWAAIKDFSDNVTGKVTFFLRDYDGVGSYTEIGSGDLSEANWQGGSSTFVKKTITIPDLSYTVPVGHKLESKLIVDGVSGDDMWFAYDTLIYPSVIKLLPYTDTWWDSSYNRRIRLDVATGASSPSGGYNGYTVRLASFDTADLVSTGKMQANCDDLRAVRWDSGASAWTELDRDMSSCNTTSTIVSFKLQADIAASSSDDSY